MTTADTLNSADVARHTARIARDSGSSFYWAMRLLGREPRAAMYAVYAFCRAVDDIADDRGETSDKLTELGKWREEISRVFAGSAETPTGQALQIVLGRYALEEDDFLAVIHGMETDAAGSVRIADNAALEAYMDDVACAVGRLCTPIFGIHGDMGRDLAKSLGEALQITNILRDLKEDASMDRLYLPLKDLEAAGCPPDDDLRAMISSPAGVRVCDALVDRAEARFGEADRLLNGLDRTVARAPRLMLEAYRRLLSKIARRGWSASAERVSLSLPEKVWVVLRYGWA